MPDTGERLAPGQVATRLFGLAPDRDERAPQLCQEALLTLALNGYEQASADELQVPPKRERFALRSLALSVNFLAARADGRAGDDDTAPQLYGERLANGEDTRGSAELGLARQALEGLIDPDTRKGQPGGWLLFPFHESLLWYDARRQSSQGRWGVRRVWMRGGGITIARMLANPPPGTKAAPLGEAAIRALRDVLRAPSPLADIADQLERPLHGHEIGSRDVEAAEREAWQLGGSPALSELADRICRDAEGILCQGGASAPAKLWQLRSMLALDVAMHALKTAWQAKDTPDRERYLLLSFAGPPRAENRVRQRSEASLSIARIRLEEAILGQLASDIKRLDRQGEVNWHEEFVSRRGQLNAQIEELRQGGLDDEAVDRIAREIIDQAEYGRPVTGFVGLIQTAGLVAGTGQYRYLTATPELFSALVGALSARMPMSSDEFFDAVFEEWGLVIGQNAAARTALNTEIDGAQLERNARRAEQQLADSGLALALSDRTTVVGERAGRQA
jgi:hypothetical protein